MTIETCPIEVEPRTKTVGDVLRHAARIIEERGWCQMQLENDGALCIWGGIATASDSMTGGMDPREAAAMNLLQDRLRVYPPQWNDTPGRTAAEVTAALRAAADEADRG